MMSPDELFQRGFTKQLVAANELPQLILDIDPTVPGPILPNEFPARTLGWLRSAAILEYKAVITLLANAECGGEAEHIMRPLIDTFCHVVWIQEGVDGGGSRSVRCRALCLDLGVARYRLRGLAGERGLSAAERARYTADLEDQVQEFRRLHDAEGCRCKGRTYRSATTTLHALARADPRYEALVQQRRWSSSALHVFEPGRMARGLGDGRTLIGGPVRAGWRATMLLAAVDILAEVGVRLFHALGMARPDQDRLIHWKANFVELPPLRNALRGEFD